MLDRLTRDWEGKTVVLIGGGPSLRRFNFRDLSKLRKSGAVVVAINDAIKRCPWSDVVFSIDKVWLGRRHREVRRFSGERIAVVDASRTTFWPWIRYIARDPSPRLSDDMGVICTGENSGFAALGMSLMRGAGTGDGTIIMLGYDMNGPGHFHGGYEWTVPSGPQDYPRWVGYFLSLALAAKEMDAKVVNCNPESAVRCFPFADIVDGQLRMRS